MVRRSPLAGDRSVSANPPGYRAGAPAAAKLCGYPRVGPRFAPLCPQFARLCMALVAGQQIAYLGHKDTAASDRLRRALPVLLEGENGDEGKTGTDHLFLGVICATDRGDGAAPTGGRGPRRIGALPAGRSATRSRPAWPMTNRGGGAAPAGAGDMRVKMGA